MKSPFSTTQEEDKKLLLGPQPKSLKGKDAREGLRVFLGPGPTPGLGQV